MRLFAGRRREREEEEEEEEGEAIDEMAEGNGTSKGEKGGGGEIFIFRLKGEKSSRVITDTHLLI